MENAEDILTFIQSLQKLSPKDLQRTAIEAENLLKKQHHATTTNTTLEGFIFDTLTPGKKPKDFTEKDYSIMDHIEKEEQSLKGKLSEEEYIQVCHLVTLHGCLWLQAECKTFSHGFNVGVSLMASALTE